PVCAGVPAGARTGLAPDRPPDHRPIRLAHERAELDELADRQVPARQGVPAVRSRVLLPRERGAGLGRELLLSDRVVLRGAGDADHLRARRVDAAGGGARQSALLDGFAGAWTAGRDAPARAAVRAEHGDAAGQATDLRVRA